MKTSWICRAACLSGVDAINVGADAQTLTDSAYNVACNYSHRLPDDAIVYPGKRGIAMQHDFLGNTTANAYSTADTLLAM